MTISHDPALTAQFAEGEIVVLPLIKFDIPGLTLGYHYGGQPIVYDSLEYKPNQWLVPGEIDYALGNDVSGLQVLFSGIHSEDPGFEISQIEAYNYLNAPVTVTFLGGEPNTNNVLGVINTQHYEIAEVNYNETSFDDNGKATLTIVVSLEPAQRRFSDSTYAQTSLEDQQLDNDPNCTFYEYVAVAADWPIRFGRRQQ